jgi:hypothetical protein
MKVKPTRRLLLGIVAGMGGFIIVYSLFRALTGLSFEEDLEKTIFDMIVIAALGILVYNRRIARDEKKARSAKAEADTGQAEDPHKQ